MGRHTGSILIVTVLVAVLALLFICTGQGGGGGECPKITFHPTIEGKVVDAPIVGAEVQVFYLDSAGKHVMIPSVAGSVYTQSNGSFSYPLPETSLMPVDTPLIVRTSGGVMGGSAAPSLTSVIADSEEGRLSAP